MSALAAAIEDRRIALHEGELRVRCYRPTTVTSSTRGALVFFHGGGLVVSGIEAHDELCSMLASAADCRVISVDYAWSPDRGMLGAVDDCYAALCAVHENAEELGFDHRYLAVGGESVGATLATVVARLAKDRRNPPLALQLLICPVLSLQATWGAAVDREYARGTPLTAAKLETFAAQVLGSPAQREDPRVSPLLAKNLIGLPKTVVVTAEYDPTRADAEVYVAALRASYIEVQLEHRAGVGHAFASLEPDPQNDATLLACATALAAALHG